MNMVRVLCVTAAFSLPQIANAAEPFTKHAFGMLEGTLAFCTQVNPQSASKYQDKAKRFAAGVPEKQVTAVRGTREYQSAYQSASEVLGGMSKEQVTAACSDVLQGGK